MTCSIDWFLIDRNRRHFGNGNSLKPEDRQPADAASRTASAATR